MFRLNGPNAVKKALKEPLDTEDDVCLVQHFDVDAVVSPLKTPSRASIKVVPPTLNSHFFHASGIDIFNFLLQSEVYPTLPNFDQDSVITNRRLPL